MNRLFISMILCLLTTSAFAQRESGGFANTARLYQCKDKSENYFVTLNMLGPNLRTVTVATARKIILSEIVIQDTSIKCFAPCEFYKDDSGRIEFSLTKLPSQITGLFSAPHFQLELSCEVPAQRNLECDSRKKNRSCN